MFRFRRTMAVVGMALGMVGCDDGQGSGPDGGDEQRDRDTQPEIDACSEIELGVPDNGVQLSLPLQVPASSELEYCKLVMLEEDLNLRVGEGYYTDGSHHGNVHRTSYHGEIPTEMVSGEPFEGDPTQPHPCPEGPGDLWDTRGVIAGGRPLARRGSEDRTTAGSPRVLPDNTAFRLKKGDVLVVNFHMINTHLEPVDSCFKINLNHVPDGQVEHELGSFFLYDIHVTLPPASRASARMACPVLSEAKLLTAVSHMHARGVRARATLWDGKPSDPGAKPLRELYDQSQWAEPPVVAFDEPLALSPGQWIEWSCDYENDEERAVAQGTASTDEMCMFIGAYYPRNFFMEQCADPDTGETQLNGINLSDGKLDGPGFLACLQASPLVFGGNGDDPDRYETLSCFTNTCAAVSPLTQPLLHCLAANGAGGCADLQAELEEATCDASED